MISLFSVDDHIIEPPGVWQDRVPEKFRATAPQVREEPDGTQYWTYEDTREATMGLNAVAGKPIETWGLEPKRFEDMIPACYDPVARARELLSQGVCASVAFPSLPRFGGALFASFKDKELAAACVRAWNDFVLDEWCPAGPRGLYVPMTIAPLWDPQAAAAELRRCVANGARAICLPENPAPLGLPSYWQADWDPLWQAVTETGVPACMHIGSSGQLYMGSADSSFAVPIATMAVASWVCAVDISMSPVFAKFPDVQIVWSEGGVGWVPAALERADRQWERHRYWSHLPNDVRPSEVFRRNFTFCMIEEPWGLEQRGQVGVDRIVWEADFPHADTPYPHIQKIVTELFAGVSAEDRAAITHRNAERLFGWEMADLPA
ncbi:amidohydrolase family protein [Frankia sp. Cas3]|uniref:amidohydrolase family protein n=1 Tax=Frankia sp. Cas3 TaxID=3073926 RepID=UPI002AD4E90E|nr:amidohydrolase family protein [Frankia sp. Cas3]